MGRIITIKIEDLDNGMQVQGQFTDKDIEDIKNNIGLDTTQLLISKLNKELDIIISNKKSAAIKERVVLGATYDLDLGSSAPVSVRPIEFIGKNQVLCAYLNSYDGRMEVLDVSMF